MRFLVVCFFLFFEVGFSKSMCGQSISEFDELKKSTQIVDSKKHYSEAKNNQNELEFTFSALFLFYKNFVSSQDNSHCNFTPSCSEYALQSIKKFGLLKGGLNALDRLSRCNGLAPEQYEVDEQQHLLIDKP
jgi:uncharacterized protein